MRQTILHIFWLFWGCFTLRWLRNCIFQEFRSTCRWVKSERATNRDNNQSFSGVQLLGVDPKSSLPFGVCDFNCGMVTNLVDLTETNRNLFPRSCEHCFACGKLLQGSYERGCAVHFDPALSSGYFCPKWDFSSTELFQETLQIVGNKELISDFVWKLTLQLVEKHPAASSEGLATVVFATPQNDKD